MPAQWAIVIGALATTFAVAAVVFVLTNQRRRLRIDVGALVGHVADISVEREERERLRLAEERFRNAFTHATTGMALVTPDGRYLQVNEALCRIAGRSAEDLLGMLFLDIRHPDDRAMC